MRHHSLESNYGEDHNYFVAQEEERSISVTDSTVLPLKIKIESPNNVATIYKRVRRSEASLAQAAKYISNGQTFQTVSNMFNIPVSTIRFYMARKGILPKRKRGRGVSRASNITMSSHSGLSEINSIGGSNQHSQDLSDFDLQEELTNAFDRNSSQTLKSTSHSQYLEIDTASRSIPSLI